MENGKEPAYPQSQETKEYFTNTGTFAIGAGLTKREYFAAMAMQGMLAANSNTSPMNQDKQMTAIHAVQQADMILKALEE